MSEIAKFYDEFSETYDDTVLKDADYTAYEVVPTWIIHHVGANKVEDSQLASWRVLDLGCGTGLSSNEFFKINIATQEKGGKGGVLFSITGLDISPGMLDKARLRPFEKLHCQSLEEVLDPQIVPDSYFHTCVMLGVMEFIQNPLALFLQVHSKLTNEGLFGVTIPEKLTAEEERAVEILTFEKQHIESLFDQAGFVVLKAARFLGFISRSGVTVMYNTYLLKKK